MYTTEQKLTDAVNLLKQVLLNSGIESEYDQAIHDYLEDIGEDVSNSYLTPLSEDDQDY